MLRSRMFTPGFKIFFGIFAFLITAAYVFGVSTALQVEGQTIKSELDQHGLISYLVGPMTLGWKGPVGNHLGYSVLVGGAAIAAFVAFVLVAFRDADPEAEAQILQVETVPLTKAPSGTNFTPIVAALAVGLVAVGWVISGVLFYSGLALLAMVAFTWTVRAWAERATGDDEVNHEIYVRFIDPFRVPIVATLAIGFVVFGLSRILLAVPSKNWSSIVFLLAAVVAFGGILVVYFAPANVRKALSTALVAVAALTVLGFGIYGIAKGERPVEHHGTEPAGAEPGGEGEGHG